DHDHSCNGGVGSDGMSSRRPDPCVNAMSTRRLPKAVSPHMLRIFAVLLCDGLGVPPMFRTDRIKECHSCTGRLPISRLILKPCTVCIGRASCAFVPRV